MLAIVVLGLLAACGDGSTSINENAGSGPDSLASPAPESVERVERKIAALTDVQRKTAFYRAIYDADFQCGEIVKVDTKPRDGGKPVWLATCDDRGEYVITLQPGGIFTVSGVPQAKRRMPKGTVMLPTGTK